MPTTTTDDGMILDDEASAEVTLGRMRDKVLRTVRQSDFIVNTAARLAALTKTRDRRAQAQRIAGTVARSFRFVSDPVGVQVVRDPEVMLWDYATGQAIVGNCVEGALLVGTLAQAVGMPVRFVAYAYDADNAPYSHVVAQVQLENGRWIPLDVTKPPRSAPHAVTRALVQEV